MHLLAIDPGPTRSAFVMMHDGKIQDHAKCDNDYLMSNVVRQYAGRVVVEMIASYGRPVGAETFETCVLIGRIAEASNDFQRMYRRDVTKCLCDSSHKTNDAIVRQRLIDIYSDNRGKDFAIGKKASPGPLYGIKSDEWQALALGVAYSLLNLGWRFPA